MSCKQIFTPVIEMIFIRVLILQKWTYVYFYVNLLLVFLKFHNFVIFCYTDFRTIFLNKIKTLCEVAKVSKPREKILYHNNELFFNNVILKRKNQDLQRVFYNI